jgi:hypothetical protein
MPELPSPDPVEVPWPQCACPDCTARREQLVHPRACPCPECQPGRGIDFEAQLGSRTIRRRAELRALLLKNDLGGLTATEEARLDKLCSVYVMGSLSEGNTE